MTYQSPPPGSPYPPGPPGGFPPPGGKKPGFDPKSVNVLDWAILGAALLAVIFSFFPFYKASVSGFGFKVSDSSNGWHGLTWLATVLVIVAGALLAIQLFAPSVKVRVPTRLAVLGLFAVAFVFYLLNLFWVPYDTGGISGVDKGHSVGYWLGAIAVIAGLALSVVRLKETGGSLPWEKSPGAVPGGYPPPAAGGYPQAPGGTTPPPPPGSYPPPPSAPGGYPPPPPPAR